MTLYVPPHFAARDPDVLFEFVRRHAFATMVSGGAAGMQVSHIPFVAERDGAGRLRLLGHVARANTHWQSIEAASEVLAIFHGPHGYVSPGWYQQLPAVPTWNYAVVHARGKATLMEEAELHELVMTLSSIYEEGRTRPWKLSEQPADFVSSLLKSIVGFAIEVDRLEGKFKLSQNRPQEVPRVVEALEREEPALAAFMRAHANGPKGKIPP